MHLRLKPHKVLMFLNLFQDHCDFLALRNLVLAHHMEDLKETTHKIHYERFR